MTDDTFRVQGSVKSTVEELTIVFGPPGPGDSWMFKTDEGLEVHIYPDTEEDSPGWWSVEGDTFGPQAYYHVVNAIRDYRALDGDLVLFKPNPEDAPPEAA